jgi:HK97 family phage prohead protease
VVLAPAMVTALKAWTEVGKLIPLLWSHSAAAEDVVGHIRPESAKAVSGQVVVSGWIDQSTERGKEAWRLVKSGVLGFSFGYLILDAVKRDDGVREIRALDVYEISATSTPMNGTTRVLSWKSRDAALLDVKLPTMSRPPPSCAHTRLSLGSPMRSPSSSRIATWWYLPWMSWPNVRLRWPTCPSSSASSAGVHLTSMPLLSAW